MKKTLKDYFYVIFGSACARGVAFVNAVIIARILGPGDFGLFSIFYAVMILTWQIPQAFDTTFVRYAKADPSAGAKRHYLSATVLLKILYLVMLASLMYPLARFLSHHVFDKPRTFVPIMAALASGGLLSFLMTIASTYQEQERFFHFAVLNAFYTVSIFIFLIVCVLFSAPFSLSIVVGGYFYITAVIGIVSIIALLKRTGNVFRPDWAVMRRVFSLAKWILGVTCAFFVFQRIDLFFLTRFVSYETIGIYSVAAQLVVFVFLLTGSLANISLPKASTAIKTRRGLIGFAKESCAAAAAINILILLLIVGAPYIISLIYGSQYDGAAKISRILLLGWFFTVPYIPFSFLFYSLDDSRTRFLLELSKLAFGVVLLSVCVPRMGMTGAAVAVSATLIISTVLSSAVLLGTITRRWRVVPNG